MTAQRDDNVVYGKFRDAVSNIWQSAWINRAKTALRSVGAAVGFAAVMAGSIYLRRGQYAYEIGNALCFFGSLAVGAFAWTDGGKYSMRRTSLHCATITAVGFTSAYVYKYYNFPSEFSLTWGLLIVPVACVLRATYVVMRRSE